MGDVCVIGEATVRLGVDTVRKFVRKVNRLVKKYSKYIRPRMILVIYTATATREAVEEAEKAGIWLLKATKDITKPPKLG